MKPGPLACLVLLVTALSPNVVRAEVQVPAQVRYETQAGWSDWHKMQITLLKGKELNTRTKTFNYSAYSLYGILWFAQGQAAIIESSDPLFGCPAEMTVNCIPRFGNITGKDQDGDRWEICTSNYC